MPRSMPIAILIAAVASAQLALADAWTHFAPEEQDQLIVYVDKTGGNDSTGEVYEWTQDHPQTGDDPFNPPQQPDPNDKIKPFENINAAYNALISHPMGGWPAGGAPGWILLKRGEKLVRRRHEQLPQVRPEQR